MEYMGNKEYWDEKSENKSNKQLSPEKTLVENLGYFRSGSVLDIACGDGRNTLFLIENNFKVTGVDFSIKALSRLEMFAKRNNYYVKTKQIDLCELNSLYAIGIFDNIVVNHYRLSKEQLENIKNHICVDGILFISGFGDKHKVDSKIRKEDLIQASVFFALNFVIALWLIIWIQKPFCIFYRLIIFLYSICTNIS